MHPSRTWEYYQKEYVKDCRSFKDIGDEWGENRNTIRREVIKLGIKPRSHSEAQAKALEVGRAEHPTRGKRRPEDVRLKISESMTTEWKGVTPEERTRRSNLAKTQWKNMDAEDQTNLRTLAMAGLKHSAKHGSALEKFLYENLLLTYPTLQYHCKHVVEGTTLHLDLVIPDLKIAIEIDGPSHSLPIWGQETLNKVQSTDEKKNVKLSNFGFIVIRLQHLTKNLSDSQKRKYLAVLKEKIEEVVSDRDSFVGRIIYLTIGEN